MSLSIETYTSPSFLWFWSIFNYHPSVPRVGRIGAWNWSAGLGYHWSLTLSTRTNNGLPVWVSRIYNILKSPRERFVRYAQESWKSIEENLRPAIVFHPSISLLHILLYLFVPKLWSISDQWNIMLVLGMDSSNSKISTISEAFTPQFLFMERRL